MAEISACPIPGARGSAKPEGTGANGVLMLGEALGDAEREEGLPFRPSAPAGSVLERAIRRLGMSRDQFVLFNTVNTQPPHNYLEGAPYEEEAIAWGLQEVAAVVAKYKPRCILALGNVPLSASTGLRGILESRGYAVPSRWGIPCIGTLHPSFLRRGEMSYLGVLIHDIAFAVALASARESGGQKRVEFWSPVLWRRAVYTLPWPLRPLNEPDIPPNYIRHPTEEDALSFEQQVAADPQRIVAYDIETPRSAVTKEDASDELEEQEILSVQFSLASGSGIFLPWREPFVDIAKRILASPAPKVGCNNWRFDDPRLRAHGCTISGQSHDLRWAWKSFQPDLSAALQFINSFYAPISPWKHLAGTQLSAYYGIRDVDACLRIV